MGFCLAKQYFSQTHTLWEHLRFSFFLFLKNEEVVFKKRFSDLNVILIFCVFLRIVGNMTLASQLDAFFLYIGERYALCSISTNKLKILYSTTTIFFFEAW